MRYYFYTFLLVVCSLKMHSQTLSGIVFDENKETIAGASVYLDGTSIGTITDDQGKYELHAANKINTTLVIGFIGYESKIIANPFENPNQKIYLVPKETHLKEVTVIADGFSRADKLKIFREEFLGKTKAGRSCKILNETDISFSYDTKTNQLAAFSSVPIQIQNNYLGYEIAFSLVDFYVNFNLKSIKSADVYSSYLAGTTFYKDNIKKKKAYLEKRKKTYYGSQMHFFRNLSKNIWDKKSFQLFEGSYLANPNDHFQIQKNAGIYTITIKDSTKKKPKSLSDDGSFYKSFNLLYDKSEQSNVVFKSNTFHVDEYGNNEDFDVVLFGGELGKKRAGDMLPMNFTE
ncbi:hypothetical protein FNO01nite_16300 [Flavobacterium noncentrifugens]|uniref:CarboxypepD_reg-like domain-containing protein n=1 Tax=Flavobacterium noncentrifugens TaxID=1128970 RepID=A0A1G8WJM0_9FLAO|nr:carboxypeptidase-like regulatory domain-containing protein [Flavobacterium noncentrifugens]GEP50958.1 hypothetical protein FNO01nite_16300 [Flavobacterium noncentrifugens]SDJ78504.1 CarboxypepD_reg-like domain-containing protein [Flavobacterium noncentrifugens]